MTFDENGRPGSRTASGATGPHDVSSVVRAFCEGRSGGRALDVATGCGRNAIFLAEQGRPVDAIDISRAQLERARSRAASRSVSVEWILADVDSYGFPASVYDVVTVSYYDARDRLPAVKSALAPGGVLVYEHYLESPGEDDRPRDQFRFASNELLSACADLQVRWYVEGVVDGEPRVTLAAQKEGGTRQLPDLSLLE